MSRPPLASTVEMCASRPTLLIKGGARNLCLPNGKKFSLTLPARSTTVFDAVP